jgi:hypothetical protein
MNSRVSCFAELERKWIGKSVGAACFLGGRFARGSLSEINVKVLVTLPELSLCQNPHSGDVTRDISPFSLFIRK